MPSNVSKINVAYRDGARAGVEVAVETGLFGVFVCVFRPKFGLWLYGGR